MQVLRDDGEPGYTQTIILTENLQNSVFIIFVHSFTKSGWQADSNNPDHSIHRMAYGDPLSCTPGNWGLKEKSFFPWL